MLGDIENLKVLEINFKQLKSDYEKDKIDLYVARIEAQTIIRNLLVMKHNTDITNETKDKITSLFRNTNDLLYEIIHDIENKKDKECSSNI